MADSKDNENPDEENNSGSNMENPLESKEGVQDENIDKSNDQFSSSSSDTSSGLLDISELKVQDDLLENEKYESADDCSSSDTVKDDCAEKLLHPDTSLQMKLQVFTPNKCGTIVLSKNSTVEQLIVRLYGLIYHPQDFLALYYGCPPRRSTHPRGTLINSFLQSNHKIYVCVKPENYVCKKPILTELKNGFDIIDIRGDGSCFFHAISYVLYRQDDSCGALRSQLVQYVSNHRDFIDPVFLENKTIDEYIIYLKNPANWGGGIDTNLISEMLEVEICVISTGKYKVSFGEGRGFGERVYLLFTNSHYDAIGEFNNGEIYRTVFAVDDDESNDTILEKFIGRSKGAK